MRLEYFEIIFLIILNKKTIMISHLYLSKPMRVFLKSEFVIDRIMFVFVIGRIMFVKHFFTSLSQLN